MNIDELRREAGLVMAAAKANLETIGRVDPIAMLHWPEEVAMKVRRHPVVTPGAWFRFPVPGEMMNSGPAKQQLFGALRELVRYTGADAVIFATELYGARETAKGHEHRAEIAANVDKGFERLVRLGWVMREEAVMVTAQMRDTVLMMKHAFRRHERMQTIEWFGATESHEGPQAEFKGRQKMYGEFNRDTLGEPPEGSWADRQQSGEA